MWFNELFLPHARRIPGKKALIGDNLSSHFSTDIVEKCLEYDIAFICLPPNSTHLCQPLDVSLFGPLKSNWKTILNDYKVKNPNVSAVQKPKFPALFKRLLNAMNNTISINLISGFRTCGIVPLNREVVKSKLQYNQIQETPQNNELISFLREQRGIEPEVPAEQQGQDEPGTSSTSQNAPGISATTQNSPGTSATTQNAPGTSFVRPEANHRAPKRKRKSSKTITPGRPVTPEDLGAPVTERVRATAIRKKRLLPSIQAVAPAASTTTEASDAADPVSVVDLVLSVGDCVIVKLMGKRKETKYAALVKEVDGLDINLNFLKPVNIKKRHFYIEFRR